MLVEPCEIDSVAVEDSSVEDVEMSFISRCPSDRTDRYYSHR